LLGDEQQLCCQRRIEWRRLYRSSGVRRETLRDISPIPCGKFPALSKNAQVDSRRRPTDLGLHSGRIRASARLTRPSGLLRIENGTRCLLRRQQLLRVAPGADSTPPRTLVPTADRGRQKKMRRPGGTSCLKAIHTGWRASSVVDSRPCATPLPTTSLDVVSWAAPAVSIAAARRWLTCGAVPATSGLASRGSGTRW